MVYEKLSALSFLNRYSHKFLFVAFLGIHIPLLTLVAFLATRAYEEGTATILWIVLGATLVVTGLTLLTLNQLLSPILEVSRAVREYRKRQQLPDLPTHFEDEAGQLMREVQLTLKRLDQANRDKEDLIGLLSHDMRTPASSALGLAEYLRSDESLPEHVREMGMELEKLSQGQLEMLDNTLSLLRTGDEGAPKMEQKEVVASKMIERAIARNQSRLDKKEIEAALQCRQDAVFKGNAELLQSVVDNLLSNAIKFTDPGKSIHLQLDADGEMGHISVQDEGIGFSPEIGDQLFKRFTKAGRTGTGGEASTGLGLYLCWRIARAHGGHIKAHSDGPGKGSTFTVSLPLYQ